MDTSRHLVKPGTTVTLGDWDPGDTHDWDGGKKQANEQLEVHTARLDELQQVLFAEDKHRVLIVLQGMDTSGKDGTVRHVLRGVNPVGVDVANFKKPNDLEMEHDYLWRVHKCAPRKGEIMVFNRSHYEDVLVVRVHELVPPDVWGRRYDHINAFEQMLADEGTTILKFFLHISKKEQKERLEARLEDPAKHWKFDHGDIDERKLWDQYTEAYEAALSRTSTQAAPWYVIPANHKWYRNLVISSILVETLDALDMQYPPAPDGLDKVKIH
jgi:PPK2 family polyphosphate:nucleotide phosphotransferase